MTSTQASASRHEAEALRWASTAEQLKTQLESRSAKDRLTEGKVAEMEKKFKQVRRACAKTRNESVAATKIMRNFHGGVKNML